MKKWTADIPASYNGREQAFIKHRLLQSYLQKLVLIIGMSARRQGQIEICYVDCFAGPWGDSSEKLEGTSIAISLDTLAQCRFKLATLGINATVRALYIEKNDSAFHRLDEHLSAHAPKAVQAECWSGDFVELRHRILDWCGRDAFAFFFIDPKGWKDIGVGILQPLLRRPRSEFLINFMYGFINRAASMAEQMAGIAALLGTEIDLEGVPPDEREDRLLGTYRQNLKQCVPYSKPEFRSRTAYVRVMEPEKERLKYHLVYLTSHPAGVIEFMELSEDVDLVQKQVRSIKRHEARARQTGTMDMFGPHDHHGSPEGRASPEDVDRFWVQYLHAGEAHKVGRAEFADILESTDWFPCDLQASLARLIKAGKIRNLDTAEKRPRKPLHVEKNERLQLAAAAAELAAPSGAELTQPQE